MDGCAAVRGLARVAALAALLVRAGGCGAVLGAMGQHAGVEEVQVEGCWALLELSAAEGALARLDREGALQAVLRAAEQHFLSAGVLEPACRVIAGLASSSARTGGVLRAGGAVVVLQAMETLPKNARVSEAGCEALRQMAACSSKADYAAAGGWGVAYVIAALRTHKEDPGVQEQGLGALVAVAAGSHALQRQVWALGGSEVAQDAVVGHFGHDRVEAQGSALLAILEVAPSNSSRPG